MTIRLNVLITLSETGKTFSVWSENRPDCPEIEIYEGHGFNLSSAIDNFYANLPNILVIDDDTSITPSMINYTITRPFKVSHLDPGQLFKMN